MLCGFSPQRCGVLDGASFSDQPSLGAITVGSNFKPKRILTKLINKLGSSAEFVGKTVFHRRLRRPRCSPSLKASLASSAAAPALTLGCAPRCRLVWAMGNGASGGGSGHRV